EWFDTPDIKNRGKVEWTSEHERSVGDFYYLAYIYHFQEEVFAEALATIPYAFVCDDHDILDGFGSYPAYLMDTPVMQNVGRLAYRFYLLFQHHTTFAEAGSLGLFPAPAGFSWLRRLGPSVAVLAIDNRSQRTEHRVVPERCWAEIWRQLDELSEEKDSAAVIKHLIVVATVPVVYPRMKLADSLMDSAASITEAFRGMFRKGPNGAYREEVLKGVGKSKVMSRLLGQFGQP
ncbi:hypothetical protein HK405_001071, partial [Cladochytrium tenue]